MEVINWDSFLKDGLQLDKNLYTSMTVGIFDGVHRGHQALIKRIVSHNAEFIPAVITFRQNHKINNEQKDILTFQQRLETFEKSGIKITVVIDFNEDFRQMSGEKFLEILLKNGNAGYFAVGSGFRCGYRLDTDAVTIQRFFTLHNIPAEIIPEICYPVEMEEYIPISSSRIRSAIASGNILQAEAMLGYKI